jgi:hypothetical protein
MRASLFGLRGCSIVTSLLLGLSACASDPGAGSESTLTDSGRPRPDTGGPGDDTDTTRPPTGEARLEFVSDDAPSLPFEGTSDLAVRYIDAQGDPIANATIEFDLDEDFSGGSRLRTSTQRTGDDGTAAVGLVAGNIRAEFSVVASVRGTDVRPLTFEVTVRPKDVSDYEIQVVNNSPLRLQKAELYIFNGGEVPCSSIPSDPTQIVGALSSLDVVPDSGGFFDPYPLEVDRADMPLRTVVGIGIKADQPVAIGCTDTLPVDIEPGGSVDVTVELNPLYPAVAGIYHVESEFDLVEFLPDQVQAIVRLLGAFFSDPGQAITDLLGVRPQCELIGCPLDSLGGFGPTVIAAMPSVINGLIDAFVPADVQRVFDTGGDIYNTLTHFKLAGDLSIFDEPDENGRLSSCNEIKLTEIIATFNTIVTPPLNLESFGYQAAYGTWTGSVSAAEGDGLGYYLNIESFGLELNYGQIILFMLEQIVFPEFVSPDVQSLEDFVQTFIDCDEIALGVSSNPTVQGLVRSACSGALDALSAGLRQFLENQTASLAGVFELATPAPGTAQPPDVELLSGLTWQACPIRLADREFAAESIGVDGNDRCVWDARFGTGATPQPVPGAFFGPRTHREARGSCGDGL